MFKFDQLNQIHLEITNNCQASCPMCNRNINGGLENPLIKIQNWSLDDFKKIMNEEVLSQIANYYFCGNFGDPILNKDLIEMCRYSSITAPSVSIDIHTNGAARSKEWWVELSRALPKQHSVAFAIDGLEDTHHLYRIGTRYEEVIERANAFINAGGNAEWVFIKFKHNEHQVEEARRRSKDLGFSKFVLKNSSRFILEPKIKVVDRHGKMTHTVEPATDTPLKFIDKKVIDSYTAIVKESTINCKVQQTREVYIDAYKNLYPCCWIASVPYSYIQDDGAFEVRTQMLTQHKTLMEQLGDTNVLSRTIKEVVNSKEYQTVWNKFWNEEKLIVCARTCSINTDFSKPMDQFV